MFIIVFTVTGGSCRVNLLTSGLIYARALLEYVIFFVYAFC